MRSNILLFAASLLASGCTTSMIRSYPSDKPPQEAGLALIGEYGLATSLIQVIVSAAPSVSSTGQGKEATLPSVNFSSSIVVSSTPAKPEDKKDEKNETAKAVNQPSVCADVRRAYNEDRVAPIVSFKRHADFLAVVEAWRAVPPSTKEQKAAAMKALDAFENQKAQDDAAAARAVRLFTIIPQCPQAVNVEMKEITEVSSQHSYRLYATAGAMADNNMTVELGGGYIRTINATADDRTADVVAEGAKSLGMISTLGKSLPVDDVAIQGDAPAGARDLTKAKKRLAGALALVRKSGFSSHSVEELKNALEEWLSTTVGQKQNTALQQIDAAVPFTHNYTLSELAKSVELHPLLGIVLSATCVPAFGVASAVSESGGTPPYYDGILIPTQRNCTAVTERTENGTKQVIGRIAFSAVDASQIAQLPVPRRTLVKSTTIYTFDGGRLSKSEIIRPSPVVTAVALPGRAIGGFFQGIVGGFTGAKDVAEAENARIDAEIKRVTKAQELKALSQGKIDTTAK